MTSNRPAVLIVEDQPLVGLVASDILKECGFDTLYAYDAADAVDLLGGHPEIEVLITEAKLPGEVSGLELCHRVSVERPHLQLVITASEEDLGSGKVPQGARVLRKPYASGELKALVTAKSLLAEA
jgi:CheY-like chemotaxis protein